MTTICDRCDRHITDEQTFYHCSQCSNGNFDICEVCFSDNRRCNDRSHSLLRHRVRGDTIADADSGNLVSYYSYQDCPGCAWVKAKTPRDETRFTYDAFPHESYVRVIDLAPGPEDQPLTFSVHYARLDSLQRAQYVAISYVCGDVSAKVLSYCNGKRLDIYATLDQALRKWRTTPKQNWLRIWADAISINQDDKREKSAQVARMHEIYRHANQIFVYLGDAPADVDLALALLLRASRGFDESVKTQNQPENSHPGSIHNHRPRVTEISVEEAAALSRFAEIPWFTRLWVVQEVCLWDVYTAFPPIFLCGDHTIQWLDLISATSGLGRAPLSIKYDSALVTQELQGAVMEGAGWGPAVVAVYLQYYKIISKLGPAQNLHWFLRRTWKLQSTDPADKVYGLLGFVNGKYDIVHAASPVPISSIEGVGLELQGKSEIRVDYDLPFQTIYEQIARLSMEEENSLDALVDAGSGKSHRNPDLSSWVPDWSQYPEEPALIPSFGSPDFERYHAALDTTPLFLDDHTSGVLHVEAYFVDSVLIEAARYGGEGAVVEVKNPTLHQRRAINLKQYVLSLWWCFGVKYNRYPTGEQPFDVFWRTLIANRITANTRRIVPEAEFVESFLMASPEILEVEIKDEKPACICPGWAKDATQRHQRQNSNEDILDSSNGGPGVEDEPYLPIRDKYPHPSEVFGNDLPSYGEHYGSALHQAALGRRFFRTQGGYMGIGPRNLTRHDKVAILKGGSLPFLLRRADKGHIGSKPVFTLLGEAYVHGLSEGEALRKFDDPGHGSHWTRIILN